MKMKMTPEKKEGLIRHTLTFVGGLLVMFGYITEELYTEIIGGLMTLVGFILSMKNKDVEEENN